MATPSFREAILVSCVLHGLYVGMIGVRWARPLHSGSGTVLAFLGSVLSVDDVRQRTGNQERLADGTPQRLFPVTAGRPGFLDYRLAPSPVQKPARVRARPFNPPPSMLDSEWLSWRRQVALQVDAPRIEGGLEARPLVYVPPVPRVPVWMQPLAVETAVSARVWVSSSGQVSRVEPVVSSGDPSMDLMLLRYLRSWIFIPALDARAVESGIVHLRFRSHGPGDSGAQ